MVKKILVVYYSRTGHTEKVAELFKERLKCDIEKIRCEHNYKGIFGYIRAGYQGVKKKEPRIKIEKDPLKYDLIIIGTPNWGSAMSSPVRSYIKSFLKKVDIGKKKFIFYCCEGGSGGEKLLSEMENLLKKPEHKIIIRDREIKDNSFVNKVEQVLKH